MSSIIPVPAETVTLRFHQDDDSVLEVENEWVYLNRVTRLPHVEDIIEIAERLHLHSPECWDTVTMERRDDVRLVNGKYERRVIVDLKRPKPEVRAEARRSMLVLETLPRDEWEGKVKPFVYRAVNYTLSRLGSVKKERDQKIFIAEFSIVENTLRHLNDIIFEVGRPSEGSPDLEMTDLKKASVKDYSMSYITKILRAKAEGDDVRDFINRLRKEDRDFAELLNEDRIDRTGPGGRNDWAHPIIGYNMALDLIDESFSWSPKLKERLRNFVMTNPQRVDKNGYQWPIFPKEDKSGIEELRREEQDIMELLALYKNVKDDVFNLSNTLPLTRNTSGLGDPALPLVPNFDLSSSYQPT